MRKSRENGRSTTHLRACSRTARDGLGSRPLPPPPVVVIEAAAAAGLAETEASGRVSGGGEVEVE